MCLLTFGENEQKDGVAIANNHADKFYLTAGLYACTAIKKTDVARRFKVTGCFSLLYFYLASSHCAK